MPPEPTQIKEAVAAAYEWQKILPVSFVVGMVIVGQFITLRMFLMLYERFHKIKGE